MSRQSANLARFIIFVLGVTAVLIMPVYAAPTGQEQPRPRLNLENIPYQPPESNPNQSMPEASLAVTAPNALLPWSKVTFQSYRDGNWNVYLGNDDNSGQTAVAKTGYAEIHPHLNRGNTKIVYAVNNGGDYEIYTINVDGSNKIALTNNGSNDVMPSWSPDGSKIVYESYVNGEADIYVMNANGTNQVRLTTHGDYDGMPSWSPDGSKIAFVSRRTGGYRIYTMNADGSGQTQLSNQPYSLRPHWSPDGTQIAYDADGDNDGWQDLWRMNADGTSQNIIVDPGVQTDAWASGWAPDGSRIVYTLISFFPYQGNWYWTSAYPEAWGQGVGTVRLSSNGLDWDASWQTSDITPPTSQVNGLSAESPGPIPVSWSSSDSGGSGVYRFTVQVKVGSGAWTDWLANSSSTSAKYPGIGGETYAFRVRAWDRAFNYETWPATPDTTTMVENLPPISTITVLPAFSRYDQDLRVSWGGTDPGYSGIKNYDVQYKIGLNGSWINWKTNFAQTTAVLSGGTLGETYYFRVRATDNAENDESWPSGNGDGQTTFYRWASYGRAFDNTYTPIAGVSSLTTPAAISSVPSSGDGSYFSYVLDNSAFYTASWSKSGYGSLPATTFLPDPDGYRAVVLPPADNLVANWDFETGAAAPEWGTTGTLPQFITDTTQHTGEFSLGLGTPDAYFSSNLTSHVGNYVRPKTAFGPNGEVVLLWRDVEGQGPNTLFSELLPDGTWSTPIIISNSETQFAGIGDVVIDKNGTIHVAMFIDKTQGFIQDVDIYYTRRNVANNWSTPLNIYSSTNQYGNQVSGLNLLVTDSGIVHLVWKEGIFLDYSTTCGDAVFYTRRGLNGTWQAATDVSNGCSISAADELRLLGHGETIHVLWNNLHRMRQSNGTWAALETLFSESLDISSVILDTNGFLHMLVGAVFTDPIYYLNNENGWSDPMQIADGSFGFIAADSQENIHIAWLSPDFTGFVYSRVRTAEKVWQPPQLIFEDVLTLQAMTIDHNDKTHIAFLKSGNTSEDLFYAWRGQNGIWSVPEMISDSDMPAYLFQLEVDNFGMYHILWQAFSSNAGTPNQYYYIGPTKAAATASRAVSQQVTLSPDISNPILSFLYFAGGLGSTGNSEFVVKLDGSGGEETLFTTKNGSAGWEHHWIDLSAWSNETVTISFELNQSAGDHLAWVYLDEISLGSTYNDVWVAVESVYAGRGETVPIVISYGNRGGATAEDVTISLILSSSLVFVESDIATTGGSPPTWQIGSLPAKSETQTIVVYVRVKQSAASFTNLTNSVTISTSAAELESGNNLATGTVFTGKYLYLPLATK